MTRTKKAIKVKEPIRIRFKKLANGNQSIYLDCYKDGKRSYEFLGLYVIPETDAASKAQNEHTLQVANLIKGDRIRAIIDGKAGIKGTNINGKMLLLDWLDEYEKRLTAKGKHTPMSIKTLKDICTEYHGEAVKMQDVDKEYIWGFIDFVRNKYVSKKGGKKLNQNTQHSYCNCFTCALNEAVRSDIISKNPFKEIAISDKISATESQRHFLEQGEVKKLIKTPCKYEEVKRAYLFSVFCGLRISDIKALTWGQVVNDGENWHMELTMKKTKAPLYQPLSKEARKWMPERGKAKATDNVFHLPSLTTLDYNLKLWAAAAGVTKKMTFHTARHTFATLMLTLGADIYTTSKLLGHTDVKTTEIYAKIINKKKDEAVNKADNVNWE